jgi:hypothetical protein
MTALGEFERINYLAGDRKRFAARAVCSPLKALLFALLDGKDIDATAWKMVRPEHAKPFTNVSEDVIFIVEGKNIRHHSDDEAAS